MSGKHYVTRQELDDLARSLGLLIHHDGGGFRAVRQDRGYVFPDGGICPTATKRECMTFLKGVRFGVTP